MNYKRDIFDGDDVSIKVSRRGRIKRFFSRNFSSKFKNLKIRYKKDPKKFAVVTLGLLVAFSALVGSSYAYLTYISKTNSSTVINAGTLALVFKNDSNAITLDGALPMKDSDGLSSGDVYEFSIENTGSISATYRVALDNTCSLGKSYEISGASVTPSICIPDNYIKVAISENGGEYKTLERKSANEESSYIIATGMLNKGKSTNYKMKIWLDYSTPNMYNSTDNNIALYVGKLALNYEQGNAGNLDKSGANEPVLDDGMIPVYYDETSETWKKADENNKNETYQWYDYDSKMWANSVTVSSANRSKYQSASVGTEIPMDDILTMQVWIPRYKYKVWNYNSDGTKTSNEQQIEITFENGTNTTGEISCQDAISGTDGDSSETCKLKETNVTCTDSTCNNKTYTHPAFTFGDEEIKGFWIGKFELTGDINNITTRPNLSSLREQTVSSFETNIMKMNDRGNSYGLSTNIDTHMVKNIEWGAAAYLSHSKYGTCIDGTCSEVNINNSVSRYTGRSGGAPGGSTAINTVYTDQTSTNQNNDYGFYTYDGYLLDYNTNTKSTTKDMSKVASTTKNIYGVYDMSGGAYEYTMGNVVSDDGTTMISGYSDYTTSTYPDAKYYDKYSYSASYSTRKGSKLGDGIKEVYKGSGGWYSDYSLFVNSGNFSYWFGRGGSSIDGVYTGVFGSNRPYIQVFQLISAGAASPAYSSRLVITP